MALVSRAQELGELMDGGREGGGKNLSSDMNLSLRMILRDAAPSKSLGKKDFLKRICVKFVILASKSHYLRIFFL